MPYPFETASDILEIIYDNPGTHFRAIVELSKRQIGVVEYHLSRLEKESQIISIKHRDRKLFFPINWEDRIPNVKFLIDNLRKQIPRLILLILTEMPENQNISLLELAVKMGKSPSSLHWHIKRLVEDNLLKSVRRGRIVTLKLLIEPSFVYNLGIEIFPSRWEKFLDDIENRFNR